MSTRVLHRNKQDVVILEEFEEIAIIEKDGLFSIVGKSPMKSISIQTWETRGVCEEVFFRAMEKAMCRSFDGGIFILDFTNKLRSSFDMIRG